MLSAALAEFEALLRAEILSLRQVQRNVVSIAKVWPVVKSSSDYQHSWEAHHEDHHWLSNSAAAILFAARSPFCASAPEIGKDVEAARGNPRRRI